MRKQERLLVIANNKHIESNFKLIEELTESLNNNLPITIVLDPNAEEPLITRQHTLNEDTENN